MADPKRRFGLSLAGWPAALLAALLVLAMGVVAILCFWSEPAPERAAATGAPVNLESAPVPVDADGLRILTGALALRNPDVDPPSASPFDHPPASSDWQRLAAASEAAHQPLLRMARESREFHAFDWGSFTSDGEARRHLHQLNDFRDMAGVISDAALLAHQRGDDAEAIERLRDLRHLATAVADAPLLVNELTATGIESLAAYGILRVAPQLAIADREPMTVPATTADATALRASRGQVRALIDELLDDSARTASHARMRAFELQFEASRRIYRAFDGSDPAFDEQLLDRTMLRTEAERRLAAVSLAIRLYRLDHDDAMPSSLDALVPAYLPRIPLDPMASADVPIGYVRLPAALPDGGDRYLIYHVGDEGPGIVRRGFQPDRIPGKPQYGWDAYSGVQYRDVLDWTPPTEPPDADGAL